MRSRPDVSPWLRTFSVAQGRSPRLLCFPHAGGSAVYFARLARELAPDVHVVAVQYPGRVERLTEPFATAVPEVATAVAAAALELDDVPVAILGHSMGAILGFETARRLEEAGRPVQVLIASGRIAPQRPPRERFHLLDDESLIGHVTALGGTPAEMFEDRELRELVLGVIRADYELLAGYRYLEGPALRCPVLCLNGDADPRVDADGVAAWAEVTRGGHFARWLPGGHFYLGDQPALVAAAVRSELTSSGTVLAAR